MSDQNTVTRLGDMLVERGAITRQQLREAIEIQQARLALRARSKEMPAPSPLGEILIELGYIDRQQLTQTLSWQRRLRNATLVMSFVAPLLTTACGGGGSGATGTSPVGNNKQTNEAVSSLMVAQSSSVPSVVSSSSFIATSNQSSSLNPTASASSAPSMPVSAGVISSSSAAVSLTPTSSSSVSAPVSSQAFSSQISFAQSSLQSSSLQNPNGALDGPVLLKWRVPSTRENGDLLGADELGGYELRYKTSSETTHSKVIIQGGYVDSYYFNHLEGDISFEIAAFDTSGLYSRFVEIRPQPVSGN